MCLTMTTVPARHRSWCKLPPFENRFMDFEPAESYDVGLCIYIYIYIDVCVCVFVFGSGEGG